MTRSRRPVVAVLLAAVLPACDHPELARPAPASRPAVTRPAPPAVTQATAIHDLIERLAIRSRPATSEAEEEAASPQSLDDDAIGKLIGYGTAAFPQLLAALDDDRPAVPLPRASFATVTTVGFVCADVLREEICILPSDDDYVRSWYRTGADGQSHDRPFTSDVLFDKSTVRAWLAARPNRSLASLQLEATEWALDRETKIGVHAGDDAIDAEKNVLAPLRAQRDRLRRAVAADCTAASQP